MAQTFNPKMIETIDTVLKSLKTKDVREIQISMINLLKSKKVCLEPPLKNVNSQSLVLMFSGKLFHR